MGGVTDAADAPPGASALLEERPWLEGALAAMRDGVIIFDDRGRVAHANPAAIAYAARSSLSREPARWAEEHGLYLPDKRTPYPADALPVWRVLHGETVRDVEMFVRNARVPAGAYVFVSGSPLTAPDGKIRGAVLVFRDVTERHAQERKLAEGEQQKKAILDNIPDIAWLKDLEGRFLAVNRPSSRPQAWCPRTRSSGSRTISSGRRSSPTATARPISRWSGPDAPCGSRSASPT